MPDRPERKGEAGVSLFGRGAPPLLGRMFWPPPRFPAEMEAEYRADSLRRWTVARQVAIVLIAAFWVSYFGWDWFHGYRNQDFRPSLGGILILRGLGTLAVAGAAAVMLLGRDSHRATNGALAACAIALYLLSLGMIAITTFPYNYLFYFICLPLILTFLFGMFRLDSRLVYALAGFCLVASVSFLGFAQTTDLAQPDNLPQFFAKSLSYYNVAAIVFLLSFSLIGCAVAVELERSARDAFARESQLSDRNERLEAAREETRVKTQALVRAKDELRALAERQNAAKSKFLADAAHDLRQPMQALTNLLGAARHALGQGAAGKADKILGLAQDASRLTRTSFNAVLDISRLESGFVEAELADVDLPALVREVAAPCLVAAQEKGVEVRFRWRVAPAIGARSDRHLLGRVIGNLLANAIAYADPAKGARQAVLVGIVCLPGRIRIDVVDNGVGIAESDWARVFDPFVQLRNAERDREKGVGLGLSIVAAIVPLLPGHRIDMRSRPGSGTRFSLDLPYADDAISGALAVDPALAEEASDLAGLYALYVEDDALVRASAVTLFDTLGIRHESFASLAELEAALPGIERDPDVLITDYRLPEERTAEDVVNVTSAAFDRALPLIVVTGEMGSFDGPWLAGGRVLRKPVSPEALVAAIGAVVAPVQAV
ncbi:ATP-binding response regulator [Sphingosinicella sp.]|uniref:ATP-binding response regulator n=1 Tax=Sphingosinicella sp. TaxID=1917971 RepID=UPI00403814A3